MGVRRTFAGFVGPFGRLVGPVCIILFGFGEPSTIRLPSANLVWVSTNFGSASGAYSQRGVHIQFSPTNLSRHRPQRPQKGLRRVLKGNWHSFYCKLQNAGIHPPCPSLSARRRIRLQSLQSKNSRPQVRSKKRINGVFKACCGSRRIPCGA